MTFPNPKIDQTVISSETNFVGVKALIYISEKLALFEQRDGNGTFPYCIDLIGGGRNKDESPFDTLLREINEETN